MLAPLDLILPTADSTGKVSSSNSVLDVRDALCSKVDLDTEMYDFYNNPRFSSNHHRCCSFFYSLAIDIGTKPPADISDYFFKSCHEFLKHLQSPKDIEFHNFLHQFLNKISPNYIDNAFILELTTTFDSQSIPVSEFHENKKRLFKSIAESDSDILIPSQFQYLQYSDPTSFKQLADLEHLFKFFYANKGLSSLDLIKQDLSCFFGSLLVDPQFKSINTQASKHAYFTQSFTTLISHFKKNYDSFDIQLLKDLVLHLQSRLSLDNPVQLLTGYIQIINHSSEPQLSKRISSAPSPHEESRSLGHQGPRKLIAALQSGAAIKKPSTVDTGPVAPVAAALSKSTSADRLQACVTLYKSLGSPRPSRRDTHIFTLDIQFILQNGDLFNMTTCKLDTKALLIFLLSRRRIVSVQEFIPFSAIMDLGDRIDRMNEFPSTDTHDPSLDHQDRWLLFCLPEFNNNGLFDEASNLIKKEFVNNLNLLQIDWEEKLSIIRNSLRSDRPTGLIASLRHFAPTIFLVKLARLVTNECTPDDFLRQLSMISQTTHPLADENPSLTTPDAANQKLFTLLGGPQHCSFFNSIIMSCGSPPLKDDPLPSIENYDRFINDVISSVVQHICSHQKASILQLFDKIIVGLPSLTTWAYSCSQDETLSLDERSFEDSIKDYVKRVYIYYIENILRKSESTAAVQANLDRFGLGSINAFLGNAYVAPLVPSAFGNNPV